MYERKRNLFISEQGSGTNPANFLAKGIFEGWHNIGKFMDMKLSATYRIITVAIGILVAMVIALTLWIKNPKETAVSGFHASPTSMLPVVSEILNPIIRVHISPEE